MRYCLLCCFLFVPTVTLADLTVTSDFEGGSGVVESIDPDEAVTPPAPTPHQARGWICWWRIKVSGITPGQMITVDLGGGRGVWGMPRQAAFSTDGRSWRQTSPGVNKGKRIIYKQQIDAKQVWFAWGPRFAPSDAQALVDRVAKQSEWAQAFELCKTREGRPVPALRIRQPGVADDQRFGIWINARQHAWESGSSWVCRGLIQWLVSDDARAESLRKRADITVVPIMDIDNTAVGAGGKGQSPHDHNRDWFEQAHWPAVRAAMQRIKAMDQAGRFDLYIDLHNPGPGDRQPFYFVAPDELLSDRGKRNLTWFVQDARAEITGPMKLAANVRVSGSNYDKNWKRISKNWVMFNARDHVVAVTLETSWNTPNSTTDGYMTVGRQQGLAIERYLRRAVREQVTAQ